MGCNKFLTKEDDKLIEAASRGEFSGLSPEMQEEIDKIMPQVRAATEKRTIECLQENVEKAKSELTERLNQAGREPTDFEKIDLELRPTEKEYQEMYRIGEELGMEEWEIIDTPIIIGIKNPDTLERIENIRERVRDTMKAIHTSKLALRFRNIEVIDKIVFIDKQEPAERKERIIKGSVLDKRTLKGKLELSRTVYIFRDEKEELPREKRVEWVVMHEICHLNMFKSGLKREAGEFEKVFIDHLAKWEKACEKQLDGPGAVSPRAIECILRDKNIPTESAFTDPEFIAEHIAAWDSGLAEVCPEMKDFFDEFLSDESEER